MTFTEEWFGVASQQHLAELAKSAPEGLIVEIGSWEGRSTVALANAVYPRVVHAVDTWAGSPGEVSARLAAERDVYATWQANVAELTAGNVIAHRMDWREYVHDLTTMELAVGFAFIDAEHTYREVYDNIAALRPLMAPGGIICGDDAHHPPVREAVLAHFPEAVQKATVWSWTL
jgi:predicted O-methyltransferase YrrM